MKNEVGLIKCVRGKIGWLVGAESACEALKSILAEVYEGWTGNEIHSGWTFTGVGKTEKRGVLSTWRTK